jgi:hypothetical protein
VHLYLDRRTIQLSNPALFLPGTNRIWLMANGGCLASFRRIRYRRAAGDDPNPFEEAGPPPAPEGPPDLSEARSLFSGASLLGWERRGDWSTEAGSIVGRRGPTQPSILYTGQSDWTDGVLGFEFQGLGEGEELVVFLNLNTDVWEATQIVLPGNGSSDPEAWIPVTLEFRGDEVVIWISGERFPQPRSTRQGKVGFALGPNSECRIRNIRLALDR